MMLSSSNDKGFPETAGAGFSNLTGTTLNRASGTLRMGLRIALTRYTFRYSG